MLATLSLVVRHTPLQAGGRPYIRKWPPVQILVAIILCVSPIYIALLWCGRIGGFAKFLLPLQSKNLANTFNPSWQSSFERGPMPLSLYTFESCA